MDRVIPRYINEDFIHSFNILKIILKYLKQLNGQKLSHHVDYPTTIVSKLLCMPVSHYTHRPLFEYMKIVYIFRNDFISPGCIF